MRITESQLRRIIREEAQSLMSEGLAPGKIESPEEFKQLVPGDRITVNGKSAVVIEGVELTGANLEGADLAGAWLSGANLWGANLTDAMVSEEQLRAAIR